MRAVIIIALVLLAAIGAWLALRDGGLFERVTAQRIETALLDNRVPPAMAECMAPRLADRLSLAQLRALERAAPQEGESAIPLSTGEAMARLRRIDDPEAVKAVVGTAGGCGFELMLERL